MNQVNTKQNSRNKIWLFLFIFNFSSTHALSSDFKDFSNKKLLCIINIPLVASNDSVFPAKPEKVQIKTIQSLADISGTADKIVPQTGESKIFIALAPSKKEAEDYLNKIAHHLTKGVIDSTSSDVIVIWLSRYLEFLADKEFVDLLDHLDLTKQQKVTLLTNPIHRMLNTLSSRHSPSNIRQKLVDYLNLLNQIIGVDSTTDLIATFDKVMSQRNNSQNIEFLDH